MNESVKAVVSHPKHFKDMTGKRFGKLVVIDYAYTRKSTRRAKGYWRCKCDCGNEHITFGSYLRTGDTKSCGCAKASSIVLLGKRAKHLREWKIWTGMKARCLNKNTPEYKHYGGRGISVCQRWSDCFVDFFTDMGPCPIGHTLDRINNDGPYSPENCKWSTLSQQNRNKRNNRFVTIDGVTKCLIEWEEQYGLRRSNFWCRKKAGWSDERAIKTPPRPFHPRKKSPAHESSKA